MLSVCQLSNGLVIEFSKGWRYEDFAAKHMLSGPDLIPFLDHVSCEYVGMLEDGVMVSLTVSRLN